MYTPPPEFSVLVGRTIVKIDGLSEGSDRVRIECDDGAAFLMVHFPDCCEDVAVEDVCGDVADLIGSPVLLAEESTNRDEPKPDWSESFTWTFYKLATARGHVTIRWLGQSNGYYSESVAFVPEGFNRYA